jgi:hypothetical protein
MRALAKSPCSSQDVRASTVARLRAVLRSRRLSFFLVGRDPEECLVDEIPTEGFSGRGLAVYVLASILQTAILDRPSHGPVVPGTGGLRKIRFARPGQRRGKSGSYRACYACFLDNGIAVLAMVYDKGEQSDLTMAQRRSIAAVLNVISQQLKGEIQ